MAAPGNTDVFDVIFDFSEGVDSDKQPLLLPKNQAAFLSNATCRGSFLQDRPKYRKIAFEYQAAQPKTVFAHTTANFTNPPRGETVTINIDTPFTGSVDDQIRVGTGEGASYRVFQIQGGGLTLVVVNVSGLPASVFLSGADVFTPAIAGTSAADFAGTLWQGGTYYKPDFGEESLVAAISGRLFNITPSPTAATATVEDVTIPGDPNPATRPQAWLWQAEKWVIWNDGLSNPVFFDGTSSRRSNYFGGPRSIGVISPNDVTVNTGIGNSVTVNLSINPTGIVAIGDTVYVPSTVNPAPLVLLVTAVGAASITGTNTNLNASATNIYVFKAGLPVSYSRPNSTELPPGRMGTYAMGRNWEVLVDGKQFIGGDIVGGSSGTAAENYRDSVLHMTENTYLAGGGFFTVPGSIGDIRFIRAMATLDRSLGQGAVQVGTPNAVFSLNATVNRLEWQDMTNPILTQSMISFGGLGQNSTINVNSDLFFRSIDGIRSLQQARKDFSIPGNVPQSIEVQPILQQDDLSLSEYGSAICFDNRLHYAVHPTPSDSGVFHPGTVVMQLDPVSSLGKKSNAVWEGLYTGLNVLQYMRGQFSGVERAFAFCYNTTDATIELWEVLKDNQAFLDDGNRPVVWTMESPVILSNVPGKTLFNAARLQDGELFVDDVKGRVDVRVEYRQESFPCWVPWCQFAICAPDPITTVGAKPGYRSRLGFGEPSGVPCEETNNRPFREGYYFQVRITFQGHLRVLALRFRGALIPQPRFALPAPCCAAENPVD